VGFWLSGGRANFAQEQKSHLYKIFCYDPYLSLKEIQKQLYDFKRRKKLFLSGVLIRFVAWFSIVQFMGFVVSLGWEFGSAVVL